MGKGRYILLLAGLLAVLLCVNASAGNRDLPVPEYSDVSVHDPSVIRADDGYYYIFGSHMAAARSADLISWEMISRNATDRGCTLVEHVQTQMKEALTYARTTTFWAPDVQQLPDGRYCYYYCCCEGYSPLSALGLAYGDAPGGPYVNQEILLKSGMPGYNATMLPNVVDPNAFFDKEGNMWMVYGSYSGGIFILKMDPATGLPLPGQSYGKKLLGKNHSRIEGPYIMYSPDTDYYYLFLSFGGLEVNDGYNIRVCRSRNPDGPYEDALGQDMIKCGGRPGTYFNDPDYEGYGVKLMGGYCFLPDPSDSNQGKQAFRSPGHNSAIYEEETGRYFIIFHTRYANRGAYHSVRVHQMFFNEDGWPVILPLRYSGEMNEPVSSGLQSGRYKIVLHERDINKTEHNSVIVTLHGDGSVSGEYTGSWSCPDEKNVTVILNGTVYRGVFNDGMNASEKEWTTCFTALDETGAALWGIRIEDAQ